MTKMVGSESKQVESMQTDKATEVKAKEHGCFPNFAGVSRIYVAPQHKVLKPAEEAVKQLKQAISQW